MGKYPRNCKIWTDIWSYSCLKLKGGLYRSWLHCFWHYSTRRCCDLAIIHLKNKYVMPVKLAMTNIYVACCSDHVASNTTIIFRCNPWAELLNPNISHGEVAWCKRRLYRIRHHVYFLDLVHRQCSVCMWPWPLNFYHMTMWGHSWRT